MDFDRLAKRYRGSRVQKYDRKRESGVMWTNEQSAVDAFLAQLPAASSIVDIPVGTGRFFELYKKYRLLPTGLDISSDMLVEASHKAKELGLQVQLRQGDIRKIVSADKSYDCALCVRFMNWIDLDGLRAALAELDRVSRSYIIVSVRCHVPPDSKLRTTQSPWQWLRAQKKRLRQRIHKNKTIIHDKAIVEGLFAAHGLTIADCKAVDHRPDQTDCFLYFLQRKPT